MLTGLRREVALSEGHRGLAGAAILSDQVTGVARKHDVLDGTLSARANRDHFEDVSKMVQRVYLHVFTGGLGLGDHVLEVPPLGVS